MRPFRRARTTPPHRPSPAAVDRLALDVDREVQQLRSGLTDDLILALLMLEEGEPEEAHRLVDVGTSRLRRFHESLERSLAAASAEREAEAVIAAAEAAQDQPENQAQTRAETRAQTRAQTQHDRRRPLGALTSVVVTAVAVAAALVLSMTVPPDDPRVLAGARGDVSAEARSVDDADLADRDALDSRFAPGVARRVTRGRILAIATEGVEVLRLFDSRRTPLVRLGEGSGGPLAVLLGVERLVGSLLPVETPREALEDLRELDVIPLDEPDASPEPSEADEPGGESGTRSDAPTEPSETPAEPRHGEEQPSPEPSDDDPSDGSESDDASPSSWVPEEAAGSTTGGGSSGSAGSDDAESDDSIL